MTASFIEKHGNDIRKKCPLRDFIVTTFLKFRFRKLGGASIQTVSPGFLLVVC
jgi:hypothetical protein